MANPRKFSEKIALHNQKQAEETAAFEKIMREVSDATNKVNSSNRRVKVKAPEPEVLSTNTTEIGIESLIPTQQSLGTFRSGSLPNVAAAQPPKQEATKPEEVTLATQYGHGGRSGGTSPTPRSPGQRGRASSSVGPMRRPADRKHDTSPYGSTVYLSNATEPPQWAKSPLSTQRKTAHTQCPMHSDETKAIWAGMRTLLQDGTLLRNYDKAFDGIAADVTRRLGELRHAENALNEEFETEIYRWAIETIGVIIFGMRLGCLDGNVHVPSEDNRRPEKTSMDDHIDDLCSLSKRCVTELTPAERFVRCSLEISNENYLVRSEHTLKPESKSFNSALKAFDKHFSLTEDFLLRALHELNNVPLRPEQVLLNKLRPLERRILPLAADMFLAGVDPLAQTAITMFHKLSLHAARQQRAHDEVTWAQASRAEGLDVQELPYISSCIKEVMRMYPATGGVVRRSVEELSVGGYEVPAGVDIVLAHGVSSKNEGEWGRANSFIPDRWNQQAWEPLKSSRAHPYACMPFGKTCPATGIVNNILSTLAERVLDKYRIEWHGPTPITLTAGVNKIQRPYYFVLQNAS